MVSPNTPQHDFTAGAGDYERRIRTLVPGYDTLHELSAAVLRAQLPDAARVLCVGAGRRSTECPLRRAGRSRGQDLAERPLERFDRLGLLPLRRIDEPEAEQRAEVRASVSVWDYVHSAIILLIIAAVYAYFW